jgi:Catalytic LigB subunit of aromatic ring-opening dioxygenase
MLGLGLASSHAPSMFRGVEHWAPIHRVLTDGVPQPPQITEETSEVLQSYIDRIDKGFGVLKKQIAAYKPDVLLVVGDDQGEVFTEANMPGLCLFTCAEVHGTINIALLDEPEDENHIALRCQHELARYLLKELNRKGLEVSESKELKPLGRPKRGIGHAFTRPVVKVTPELNIPIIPFHVNAYFPPMPSARRCYELGQSIAVALRGRPEKVAIMASGGLSHDPRGPRAGWIDAPLDHWVLQQLKTGNGEALCHLFEFDSDTLRGGTGEIRSWIVVAGACGGAPATIVDYIPAHHAVTGLGFAYWPPDALARTAR